MTRQSLVRALIRAPARILTPFTTRSLCTSTSPPSPSHGSPLKNVTRSNFEPVLAELRAAVREADFVAIDLEMTGVASAPWREGFDFDRSDVQYLKVKDSAEKFAVVQFGVCPFRWDSNANVLVAQPYNFYVFPRQEIPGSGEFSEFLCQTSSMEFLAKYQFDFNLCIREGISYLSRSQEDAALRLLENKDELFGSPSSVTEVTNTKLARMADILFSERMKIKISEWRSRLLRGGSDSHGSLNDSNETTFFGIRPALVLNGLTSRQLRLIKLVTVNHFKDLAYVQVAGKSSDRQPLIVYTDNVADRDMLMEDVKACRKKEAETKIKAAVGFRNVLDLLSSEKKLIIGHNCFLDLAHIYSKFFGPLPSTAAEFALDVQKYFPYIIDTKLLLNLNDALFRIMSRGSTTLSKAFKLLCSSGVGNVPSMRLEVQVDNQRYANWNSGAKHEAGYDAFMTGSVFAQACCHLGINFGSAAIDLPHHEKLQKYVNHLYLSWARGDIIDLRTGKIAADYLLSTNRRRQNSYILFSNMVLLWGLTPNVRARDFSDCINKVLGIGSVTIAYKLDESAALIQFSKEHLVSKFLESKDTLERSNNAPYVLHPLLKLLKSGTFCAADYETYKEICSSSISEVLFSDQAKAIGIKWRTRLVKHDEENSSSCFTGHESADSSYAFEALSSK